MGATSGADSKGTSIQVAAIAATLAIVVIGLAIGLWRWREAVEKRKIKAAKEAGEPIFEQNGFVFQKLQHPSEFDLESQDLGSKSTDRPTIPLVDLRPPVPALIRTPATRSM